MYYWYFLVIDKKGYQVAEQGGYGLLLVLYVYVAIDKKRYQVTAEIQVGCSRSTG